jgi:hypothetical protein
MSNLTEFDRLYERAGKDLIAVRDLSYDSQTAKDVTPYYNEMHAIMDRWSFITPPRAISSSLSGFPNDVRAWISNQGTQIGTALSRVAKFHTRLIRAFGLVAGENIDDLIDKGINSVDTNDVVAARALQTYIARLRRAFPGLSSVAKDDRDVFRGLDSLDRDWHKVQADLGPDTSIGYADDIVTKFPSNPFTLMDLTVGILGSSVTGLIGNYPRSVTPVVAVARIDVATAGAHNNVLSSSIALDVDFDIRVGHDSAGGAMSASKYPNLSFTNATARPYTFPDTTGTMVVRDGISAVQEHSTGELVFKCHVQMLGTSTITVNWPAAVFGAAVQTTDGVMYSVTNIAQPGGRSAAAYFEESGLQLPLSRAKVIDIIGANVANSPLLFSDAASQRMVSMARGRDLYAMEHGYGDDMAGIIRSNFELYGPQNPGDVSGSLDSFSIRDAYSASWWCSPIVGVTIMSKRRLYRLFYQRLGDLANKAVHDRAMTLFFTEDLS